MTEDIGCTKCGASVDERFDCCEVHAVTATPSDIETAFKEACDEAGCPYDNEALVQAIAGLKNENSRINSQFRNCHIEIRRLRDALLMAGLERS